MAVKLLTWFAAIFFKETIPAEVMFRVFAITDPTAALSEIPALPDALSVTAPVPVLTRPFNVMLEALPPAVMFTLPPWVEMSVAVTPPPVALSVTANGPPLEEIAALRTMSPEVDVRVRAVEPAAVLAMGELTVTFPVAARDKFCVLSKLSIEQ